MHHHTIVSGDDALATTIIEELKRAGARVVKLDKTELANAGVARSLARAEITRAIAVVCDVADGTCSRISVTPVRKYCSRKIQNWVSERSSTGRLSNRAHANR